MPHIVEYRYPAMIRHRPITTLILIPIMLLWCICMRIPAPWQVNIADFPNGFNAWFVFLLIIVVCPYHVWTSWFLMHRYRYNASEVEEYDPILKIHKRLRYADVYMMRKFIVPNRQYGRYGCVLVGNDGTEIWIAEALPIWSDIMKQLQHIPVEWQPLLRRIV